MDGYNSIFAYLPVFFVIAAVIKKGEVSIWLAIVSCYGFAVSQSAPTSWEVLSWCTAANSLLILAIAKHFHATKLELPLLMMVMILIEVILSFSHLVWFANNATIIPAIGYITGCIGYIELMLLFLMKDKPGALNELVDGFVGLLSSFVHSSRSNKH